MFQFALSKKSQEEKNHSSSSIDHIICAQLPPQAVPMSYSVVPVHGVSGQQGGGLWSSGRIFNIVI